MKPARLKSFKAGILNGGCTILCGLLFLISTLVANVFGMIISANYLGNHMLKDRGVYVALVVAASISFGCIAILFVAFIAFAEQHTQVR
jgi:hypothetical protein